MQDEGSRLLEGMCEQYPFARREGVLETNQMTLDGSTLYPVGFSRGADLIRSKHELPKYRKTADNFLVLGFEKHGEVAEYRQGQDAVHYLFLRRCLGEEPYENIYWSVLRVLQASADVLRLSEVKYRRRYTHA